MSFPRRTGASQGRRIRADVRQALLKIGAAHLYPGIPPGEWQPAAVMADMVQSLRPGIRPMANRGRLLDERHFEFRGRLSAGAQDEQRRARMEDRLNRRDRDGR